MLTHPPDVAPGAVPDGVSVKDTALHSDPERIRPVVFAAHDVAPRHRFDLWLSKYESFNALRWPDGPARSFDGCNEIWPFGAMALLRNSAPAMRFERSLRHIRRDSIDHWVVRVARAGRSRMRIGGDVLTAGPGQLLLFTLGQPADGDRSEADWISLYIPRDSVPDLSTGLSRLGNRVLDMPGAGLLADYMLMLERRMPHTRLAELPALVEATHAMVAACLLNRSAEKDPASCVPEWSQLGRIRAVVRSSAIRRARPGQLPSAAGRRPSQRRVPW